VDTYNEAIKKLKFIKNKFNKIIYYHRIWNRQNTTNPLSVASSAKTERQFALNDKTFYNKILSYILNNTHISSKEKMTILRLSKPYKLIYINSENFLYQRGKKVKLLQAAVELIEKHHAMH
jgi:hypothetical protein